MKSALSLFLVASLFALSQQEQQKTRQPRFPALYYFQAPFYPGWGYPNSYPSVPSGLISEDQVIASKNINVNEAKDVESRAKNSQNDEEKQTRVLGSFGYVSNAVNHNPFAKTLYQFASATAVICSVTSCIPAAQFVDAAAQALICPGRKRRDYHSQADIAQFDTIEPSSVKSLTATALPAGLSERRSRSQKEDLFSHSIMLAEDRISSSKNEAIYSDFSREKRNLFFYTSTITTYSFSTAVITSSLRLAEDGALTCRPANLGIC